MLCLTAVLSDNTVVALGEKPDGEFRFALSVDGKVECRYDDFEFAWLDFGRAVRCHTLESVKKVANA